MKKHGLKSNISGDIRHVFLTLSLVCTAVGFLLFYSAMVSKVSAPDFPTLPFDTIDFVETTHEAWGYFHPFWENALTWSLTTDIHSPNTGTSTPSLKLETLILDPKTRVEKEFKVSPRLRPQVLFWLRIFSQFDSKMKLVHDKNRLDLLYGYLDFSPLYQSLENPALIERKKIRIEKKVFETLALKFEEALDSQEPKTQSNTQRMKLKAFLENQGLKDRTQIKEWIDNLRTQTGQRDQFILALSRAKTLLPIIESEFKKRNLPLILTRIPFVESSFNHRAQSNAAATGIWQIMPETAEEILPKSERANWSDPEVQTKGAARLLLQYRKVLPDWSTAMTAYNSGVGRLKKLCQQFRATSIEELLDHPEFEGLGFAGKNFYPEILAVNLLELYKEEIFKEWLDSSEFTQYFEKDKTVKPELCPLGGS